MELRSIDPERNRRRRYSIAVQYRLDGGGELIIMWGRLGGQLRQRVETFGTHALLQRRYAALLARRQRHGYELLSSTLPALAQRTLTMDSSSRFIAQFQKNGYLGMFDTRLHTFVIRDVAPDVSPRVLQALAGQVLKDAFLDDDSSSQIPADRAA